MNKRQYEIKRQSIKVVEDLIDATIGEYNVHTCYMFQDEILTQYKKFIEKTLDFYDNESIRSKFFTDENNEIIRRKET